MWRKTLFAAPKPDPGGLNKHALSAHHKLVLLAVAEYMDDCGNVAVRREVVADLLGQHPNRVTEALIAARDAGWLARTRLPYNDHPAEYVAEIPASAHGETVSVKRPMPRPHRETKARQSRADANGPTVTEPSRHDREREGGPEPDHGPGPAVTQNRDRDPRAEQGKPGSTVTVPPSPIARATTNATPQTAHQPVNSPATNGWTAPMNEPHDNDCPGCHGTGTFHNPDTGQPEPDEQNPEGIPCIHPRTYTRTTA